MKKSILALSVIALLAGCSHTHYSKSEKYVQSYDDCVVTTSEYGVVAKKNVNEKSRTVHPNTACAELTAKPATKTVYSEPTVRTVKRVYLRSGCPTSYGSWC
ncbi:MAG: membrane lipoprotein lipid attachment site-containing protein [Alphaproteobacteria bacterium]|nr:membrane lipoprotein lipid attachment site-containing protein [Alphaproteobacteria bacterium]